VKKRLFIHKKWPFQALEPTFYHQKEAFKLYRLKLWREGCFWLLPNILGTAVRRLGWQKLGTDLFLVSRVNISLEKRTFLL